MYKIVRFFTHKEKQPRSPFSRTSRRTIKSGLTREEAQTHCSDPETSSKNCTRDRYKGRYLSWFDGYQET